MSTLQVCQVANCETSDTFGVLQEVALWLKTKGRRQRISRTRYETYLQWQATGGNYVIMNGEQRAGIFSIVRAPFLEWPKVDTGASVERDIVPGEPVTWLRALCTHPAHRHLNVGPFAIQAALQLVVAEQPLYLDCVSGFLPDYYAKHGFETIATQTKSYPDQSNFQITLMRSRTASDVEQAS